MKSFLVEYNNKIIGVYSTFNEAEQFIFSCQQNRLMTQIAKILTFHMNSCYQIESKQINLNQQQINLNQQQNNNQVVTQTEPVVVFDPKNKETLEKISQEKIELQHNINMLKHHKKKLDESKNIYENNIKLFELFNENKTTNPEFIIPELFREKYNIMKKLKEQDNLSWEAFNKEYRQESFDPNYFGRNDYEESFVNKKQNPINEEFDIETDSDTEHSEK